MVKRYKHPKLAWGAIASEMGAIFGGMDTDDGWVDRNTLLSCLYNRYPKISAPDIIESVNLGVEAGVFHMDTDHGPNLITVVRGGERSQENEPKKWWEEEDTPLARLMRERG